MGQTVEGGHIQMLRNAFTLFDRHVLVVEEMSQKIKALRNI